MRNFFGRLFLGLCLVVALCAGHLRQHGATTIHAPAGDTGPFSPSSISGLEVWYRGDMGVFTDAGCSTPAVDTNTVRCWADQSGNGNDATNASASTLYSTASVGGQDAIDFQGSSSASHLSAGVVSEVDFTAGDPFTVFAVLRADTITGDRYVVSTSDGLQGWATTNFPSSFRTFMCESGGSPCRTFRTTASFSSATNYYVMWKYNTAITVAGQVIRVNGTSEAITSESDGLTGANTASGSALVLGQNTTTGGSRWDGRMAEIGIYSKELSADEITSLETYLSTRYGI